MHVLGLLLLSTFASASAPEVTEGRLTTVEQKKIVDLPLKHTEVLIRVSGHLADATVEQVFQNPYQHAIEAVYLFPLGSTAAVNGMTITTSKQTIKGAINRRSEAERIYRRAKKRGHLAALLTQERPNLFTQSVANIAPREEVTVKIRYLEVLKYDAGEYELQFPMVAPPRYSPTEAKNVQPVVLPPDTRSSHDIDLRVELDTTRVHDVRSPSHAVFVSARAVRLKQKDRIPNKDFVLRYRVADATPTFSLLAHRAPEEKGSFFLVAQPPLMSSGKVMPRELIFVLDTSSSMKGAPLVRAQAVIQHALTHLRPDDTFQLVRFSDSVGALGEAPLANHWRNIHCALTWLTEQRARGSTEMIAGIERALRFPHDPARLRIVLFLTDGYVGNEQEILAVVGDQIGESRLFSFGVGSAVNRYLLEEMAALGRGQMEVVLPTEEVAPAVERFYRRIDQPVLTDITIDWKRLEVEQLIPGIVPDLFTGQPLVIAGRYAAPGCETISVSGRMGAKNVSFEVPVCLPEEVDNRAVATVWARRQIGALSRRLLLEEDPALVESVVQLALSHQLMTAYTAFVAVDETSVTGEEAVRVMVPVEVPAHLNLSQPVSSYGAAGGGYAMASAGYSSFGSAARLSSISESVSISDSIRSDLYDGQLSYLPHSAPKMVTRAVTVIGTVDRSQIQRVVLRQRARIKHCYEKQLNAHPNLEGKVVARFTIDVAGFISKIEATGMPKIEDCVANVIRSIEFPDPDHDVEVTMPFVFRTGEH